MSHGNAQFIHRAKAKSQVIFKPSLPIKIGGLGFLFSANQTACSKQSGSWNDVSTWLSSYLPTVSDQVTIDAGHNVTILNGESGSAGRLIDRGILSFQNTGKLNMGSYNGGNPLQIIDYKYHIRGGLRGINLDVNDNLTDRLFSMKLGYEDDANYFDGNIRSQTWKSNLDKVTRSFTYRYDGSSRIKAGVYAGTGSENYTLGDVTYDNNGNIKNLLRNGFKSNNSFGIEDNLNYTYQANSNKIQKVDDVSTETASFKDVVGNDYTYWADGSLRSDANKGITEIQYNYLKRQNKITFANGKVIDYQYDASGKKLKETIGTQVTDYVGNTIYKNTILYQITHDEGRIVNGIYEYNINDHLGNLRVSFKDSLGIAKIVQSNAYGVWGEDLPTLRYLNTPKINNFGYLNREFQIETGYTDLVNRQFDNIVGRFTSQDPVIEGQEHLSLYQYGLNNPLRYTDPDGRMAVPIVENDKPKPKPKNAETAQGAYGIPVYTSSTQTQGVVAGYTAGYNNNAQYGGATGNITGFRAEYNNNTGTGESNLALDGGVKATGFQATTSLRGGTENNNVGLGAEGNALLAEAKGTVGILTGENSKKGFYVGGEAGAYGLKGEVNPSITVFGYKLGVVIGGSLGSANVGAGLGAFRDTGKGTYNLSGFISGSFIAGGKLGFEIVTPNYDTSKRKK